MVSNCSVAELLKRIDVFKVNLKELKRNEIEQKYKSLFHSYKNQLTRMLKLRVEISYLKRYIKLLEKR